MRPITRLVRSTILDHHLLPRDEIVVVGVSGGPDSLALLHLLLELASEFAVPLHIAHLNHGLRGEFSEADATFVAETARAIGVPYTVESRDVEDYAREWRLSIEEAGRIVRYRFLAEVANSAGARTIAVGHNADDQVETVIMHMLRGAGTGGLRGMAYRCEVPYAGSADDIGGSSLQLIRPMLDLSRSDIEAYCRELGLLPRLDESNLNTDLFRNRLRREVIPYLEQFNPNLRQVIRHTAHVLSDDYESLSELTQRAFAQVVIPERGPAPSSDLARFVFDRERWRVLGPSLQRATLREAVRRLRRGMRNVNWAHIEDARRVASEKGVGAEATLPQGLVLVVGYDDLTIGETMALPDVPLLQGDALELRVGTAIALPESGWQVSVAEAVKSERDGGSGEHGPNRWAEWIDGDMMDGKLLLRTRRAGERFEPSGMGGRHKSLHEFMIEEKIPRHIRDLMPILADDNKVLWVCGYRADRRAQVTERTIRAIRVEFFRIRD